MRLAFVTLTAMSLLTACGGGGSAATSVAYTFIAPKVGGHLVYAENLVDNLNNTVSRTIVDDVTSMNSDGSFGVHEEDPSHNRIVSGATDQTVYPTDYRYNTAGQAISWVVTQPAATIACAATAAGAGAAGLGAPATLSVGGGWNADVIETCGAGAGIEYKQSGSLVGMETITVAAGTFNAFKFTSTITRTVNAITRTETSTRWRDATGGETRTLKSVSTFSYSGATPPAGALLSASRELQSFQ